MLITIENFGAIKYFQFDTEKDLYLIFGKNSVGKSYAISLVYLILKNIQESAKNFTMNSFYYKDSVDESIKELLQKIEDENIKELDISNYVEKHLILYFNDFLVKNINNSLNNTFSSVDDLQNKFTKENLKITIKKNNEVLLGSYLTISLGLKQNSSQLVELVTTNCYCTKKFLLKEAPKKKTGITCFQSSTKEEQDILGSWIFDGIFKGGTYGGEILSDEDYIFLYYLNEKKENFENFNKYILLELVSRFLGDLRNIHNVYYLPASRSGIYQGLNSFSPIIAELAKNRHNTSKQITLPSIPEPVADYFIYLTIINSSVKENNKLIDYINEIEKEILNGEVRFDSESKKLLFTPNETSLRLDLSTTSSMVSEISLIVFYLKYIIPVQIFSQIKPIIFIEEPEAHLHPETQVKLMTVFARMAKDNKIKLVMTSHSNYIFNKASNLVMDNKIDKEKFSAVLFEPTPEGSVAKILETDEYGIEDENFIDTAESIYEEKIDLINKLNG